MARNLRDTAVARSRADAGIAIAVEGLLVRNPADRWPVDGAVLTLAFDGASIRVSAQDEGGKIDLNWAPVALVQGLLAQMGADPGLGSAIGGEIVARRGAFRRPETPPGEVAGSAMFGGPRFRDIGGEPFESVDWLLQLPGMTRALYDRIRPFVTVYSQSAHINVATAPRPVLLSLPGMTSHDADLLLAARAEGKTGPAALPPIPESARSFAASLDTRSVTIAAEVATPSGGVFIRRAVVALTGKPYQPVQFLEWRQDYAELAHSPVGLSVSTLR